MILRNHNYPCTRQFLADEGTVRVGALLRIGLMMVLAVGLAGSVKAQSTRSADEGSEVRAPGTHRTAWQANFARQARYLLGEAPSPSAREVILRTIIVFASERPDGVDLSKTIQPLLHVFETSSDPRHRLMAIQALYNIGTEAVNEDLYRSAMRRVSQVLETKSSEWLRRADPAGMSSSASVEAV